ncbi:MAG: 2OG-Fe(II) oxygenase, partial [Parvularculaceae bacterium]
QTDEAAPMLARLKSAGAPYADALSAAGSPGGSGGLGIDDLTMLAKTQNDIPIARRALRESPAMISADNLLSADECVYVVCASAPLMQPSRVVDSEIGGAAGAQYRTSDGAVIGLVDLDLALVAIYARLARAAGVPNENCELIGVLRYRPGQEYKPHHDYLPEDAKDYSEVRRAGQRARTLLVYLNDGYEGGETKFPTLDVVHRGKTGDGFVFHNLDGSGAPDPRTLHAGAPVTRGEKWLLSLWCREKRFWFWR